MNRKIILYLGILTMAFACEPEYIEPAVEAGSYFPHTPGSRWKYEVATNCNEPMENEFCISTTWSAAGPEIFGEDYHPYWDSTYSPMMSHATQMQFVSVRGTEYFAAGYYMLETKFLDDNLEVNKTWTNEGNYPGTKVTVIEADVTKTIRGKRYKHVIVVLEEFTYGQVGENDNKTTRVHYYARGVGEIYAKTTHQYEGNVRTVEYTLLEYYIAPKK